MTLARASNTIEYKSIAITLNYKLDDFYSDFIIFLHINEQGAHDSHVPYAFTWTRRTIYTNGQAKLPHKVKPIKLPHKVHSK